ncbi:MAG: hypothetical protein DMG05_20650 [Acidobacteria bacterium]|nr:MAG: hypothetical protein DMG05_20650 [Acidobacteriota bacterium]
MAAGRVRGWIFNFFTASGRGNVEVANREVKWDKTLLNQREKPLVALKAAHGWKFSTGRFPS